MDPVEKREKVKTGDGPRRDGNRGGARASDDFSCNSIRFHYFFTCVEVDMRNMSLERVTVNSPVVPETHVAVNTSRVSHINLHAWDIKLVNTSLVCWSDISPSY